MHTRSPLLFGPIPNEKDQRVIADLSEGYKSYTFIALSLAVFPSLNSSHRLKRQRNTGSSQRSFPESLLSSIPPSKRELIAGNFHSLFLSTW